MRSRLSRPGRRCRAKPALDRPGSGKFLRSNNPCCPFRQGISPWHALCELLPHENLPAWEHEREEMKTVRALLIVGAAICAGFEFVLACAFGPNVKVSGFNIQEFAIVAAMFVPLLALIPARPAAKSGFRFLLIGMLEIIVIAILPGMLRPDMRGSSSEMSPPGGRVFVCGVT